MRIHYAGSGTIKIAGNSTSTAVDYAPGASVTLTGGSNFYGAILAQTITDAGGTAIHDDLNLNDNRFVVINEMLNSFNWAKF